ncbi:PaaI family thioesterase [Carboxydochorda subterranea]|uniref:PaaI family thioesterase n=1 Tax=Carboxydichorda subterranea TaxID=3109565 RepID=A0ABZ1BVI0_9FIRM|nr:PaaI family thioesterase [Limnochorda sp. L945t]WRP16694.1 PaaI family thioesterase [Limnochorda sp. L945t]
MASITLWSSSCYVCGRENPRGLRATVVEESPWAYVHVVPPPELAGLPGVLHGGIVTACLDEAMWYAVHIHGTASVTARIDVRFVRPAAPGVPLLAVALATPQREGSGLSRRTSWAVARLVDEQGRLIASAAARFVPVEVPAQWHRFIFREVAAPGLVERLKGWPGAQSLCRRLEAAAAQKERETS